MIAPIRIATGVVVAMVLATALSGCVSFTGPNDVRRQIATSHDVDLHKDGAVSVGPVGIFLVSTLGGPFLPVSINGLSSVDVGEYTMIAHDCHDGDDVCIRGLEIDGWEPIVSICEPGTDTIVMVDERGDQVRGLLVVDRQGAQVQIARARGDLEKVLGNFLESDLLDDVWDEELLGVRAAYAPVCADDAGDPPR